MPAIRRSPVERLVARALTGFLGHLYGGLADWIEAFVRWRLEQRRRRRRGSAEGGT